MGSLAMLQLGEGPLSMYVQSLTNHFMRRGIMEPGTILSCVEMQSLLIDKIKAQQFEVEKLCMIQDMV